ncbi:hypothetical protein HPB48_026687 [Haemaphysalis longicornis]|uniref:Uncharacterized protein n=1 Tax=Haemaphysalis longicornis TaxID=44386 RepID=A0A9J6HBC1_HAELO|nr:hypothetical protein HPB48_026687 [Haemaphysalis longicornis]
MLEPDDIGQGVEMRRHLLHNARCAWRTRYLRQTQGFLPSHSYLLWCFWGRLRYTHLVQSLGLKDSQCIVFCHRRSSARSAGNPSQLSHSFAKIPWASTSIDDGDDGGRGGEQIRAEFNKFLERLSNELNEKHDQEELSIIGQG